MPMINLKGHHPVGLLFCCAFICCAIAVLAGGVVAALSPMPWQAKAILVPCCGAGFFLCLALAADGWNA